MSITAFWAPASSPELLLRISPSLLPRIYNPRYVETLSPEEIREHEEGISILSFTNLQLIRIARLLSPHLQPEAQEKAEREMRIEEEKGAYFSEEQRLETLLEFQYSGKRGELLLLVESLLL